MSETAISRAHASCEFPRHGRQGSFATHDANVQHESSLTLEFGSPEGMAARPETAVSGAVHRRNTGLAIPCKDPIPYKTWVAANIKGTTKEIAWVAFSLNQNNLTDHAR